MENEMVQFLLAHGYLIMFVLMVAEGPIVTMAAAFLASLGYFSLPTVLLISLVGDLAGDFLWYYLGRRFGLCFVRGPGKYIGITESMITKMQEFFSLHGGRVIFAVKSTTGLCLVAFVAAGIARMNVWRFLFYSFLGGIIWSSMLVGAGYFFGYLYEEIALYISWASWMILACAVAFFIVLHVYKKKQSSALFEKPKHF